MADEAVRAEPARLEAYTEGTATRVDEALSALDRYRQAVATFNAATPNDLGTGLEDLSTGVEATLVALRVLDELPAAYASALRALDTSGALVLAASADEVDAHLREHADSMELTPEGGLSATDLAVLIADLAGIFDPTPISDGVSGLISLFRGDLAGAGLSVASMIPFAGDALAKSAKFAKLLDAFSHLARRVSDTRFTTALVRSLKHVDWNNPAALNQALGTFNRMAGDAARRYADPRVVAHAERLGLPTGGPIPFVPPKNWSPRGGRSFEDAYGNVWQRGRGVGGDLTEWDVQVRTGGSLAGLTSDGRHLNVTNEGGVSH